MSSADPLGQLVLGALRGAWAVFYLRVGADGTILESNARTRAILGESLLGVRFSALVANFDGEALAARPLPKRRFLNFLAKGTPRSVECLLLEVDGTILVLGEGDGREQALMLQVLNLNRDLAERTRGLARSTAELTRLSGQQARSLAAHQERFSAFTNEATAGIAIAGADGSLSFTNKALLLMCGQETAPRTLEELCVTPGGELRAGPLTAVAAGGRWSGEVQLRGPAGEVVEAEVRAFDLGLDGGDRVGLMFTDVGPAKRAEREVRAALRKAEELAAAKNRFVANVSHELRTPMNAIIGLAELSLAGPVTGPALGTLTAIRSAADDLLELIDAVLDFSKASAGALALSCKPFCPEQLLREVAGLLRPRAESKGLKLLEVLPQELPRWLLGDAHRLRQVLVNLVGNAVKFTESGEVELRVTAPPGALCFEIRDTGRGIEPELLPRLFRPFVQGDDSLTRRHGGTGLGLAHSQQLVALMGGRITAESTAGGSTFRFTVALPATEEPAPALPRALPSFPSVCVLLVDDNPVNQRVACGLLNKLGVSVLVADNGLEAVNVLRAAPAEIDLVLMDLQMPVMDGLAATRVIRGEVRSRVPIVALTAHGSEDERARCFEAGMNDHLTKPARLEALAAALQRHLEVSRQLSVGVEQIDADHERIVELLNELSDGLNAGKEKGALGEVLDGLINATATHFNHEEAEMKRFDYPGAAAHFEEHVALLKQVLDVQEEYRRGSGAALTPEVIAFLRAWLLKHIQGSDRALGAFLCAQSARKSA